MDPKNTERSWPADVPELIPFIPFVVDAWSDGILSPVESDILMETLDGLPWLPSEGREVLAAWLDPDAPPSPTDMKGLRARVREAALPDRESATSSLDALG